MVMGVMEPLLTCPKCGRNTVERRGETNRYNGTYPVWYDCLGCNSTACACDPLERPTQAITVTPTLETRVKRAGKRVRNALTIERKPRIMDTREIAFSIRVVQLTEHGFIALTRIGGFDLRGQRRTSALEAVQSLLVGIGGQGSGADDASIALDLALNNTTLSALQIGDGTPTE